MAPHCSLTHVLQRKNRVLPSAPPKGSAEIPEIHFGGVGWWWTGLGCLLGQVNTAINWKAFHRVLTPIPSSTLWCILPGFDVFEVGALILWHEATASLNGRDFVGITESHLWFQGDNLCTLPPARSETWISVPGPTPLAVCLHTEHMVLVFWLKPIPCSWGLFLCRH